MFKRYLKCEDCQQGFWHEIERRSDPNPDECPVCHNTGVPEPEILLWKPNRMSPKIAAMVEEGKGPALSRGFAKSGDSVYRAAETSSKARSELAAAHMGVDPSETRHMIVTDMKDNLREGDVAAKLPPNPVAEAMSQNKTTGFQQTPVAPTGQVIRGTFNEALGTTMKGVNANHNMRSHKLATAGRLASHVVQK